MNSGDPTPHLERFETYERARREFESQIPNRFNLADAIFRRHPEPVTHVAVTEVRPGGLNSYTINGLDYLSDKFAVVLTQRGIKQGDRVAVMLPQSPALIIAQLGVLKIGAVAVPLRPSLEKEAVEFAITDSAARAIVIHLSVRDNLESPEAQSALESVFVVGNYPAGQFASAPDIDFWRAVYAASSDTFAVETGGGSPAFISYQHRGGKNVGLVHSHRSVLGALSAFEMTLGFNPRQECVVWTADDWSTPAAAIGIVYPTLWYGCQMVAIEGETPANELPRLMADCQITDAFLTHEQLEQLLEPEPSAGELANLLVRTIVVNQMPDLRLQELAARSLGGARISAAYRRDEAIGAIATCDAWFEARGCGRAVPGHAVAIIDPRGHIVHPGHRGRVAVKSDDPSCMAGYWQGGEAIKAASLNGWLVTGDEGFMDENGNVRLD